MPPVLETRDLAVGYAGIAVCRGLELVVSTGEIVALVGRNGAGKTTTLHTLAGLLEPIAGQIEIGGEPATGQLHQRARAGLTLVTEERAIIHRLTVFENLRLGSGDPREALELFPELAPLRRRKAGLLSGGEQQILVLARSLAAKPRLLLIDELSFGLAPRIVRRMLDALRSAAESGTAVLLVEQHATMALSVADRAYVLGHGRIELAGRADELRGRLAEVERSYLPERGPQHD
jgi:branched-chain amino acid transport system ATP-binding protein